MSAQARPYTPLPGFAVARMPDYRLIARTALKPPSLWLDEEDIPGCSRCLGFWLPWQMSPGRAAAIPVEGSA